MSIHWMENIAVAATGFNLEGGGSRGLCQRGGGGGG